MKTLREEMEILKQGPYYLEGENCKIFDFMEALVTKVEELEGRINNLPIRPFSGRTYGS